MQRWPVLNGRYAIQGVFADSGGMGVIYEALDRRCADNVVLVKATRYDGGRNAKAFAYTEAEAVKHIEKMRKILEWEKKILVRLKNEQVGNVPSPNDFFYDRSMLLKDAYQGRLGPYQLAAEITEREPYLVMERIEGEPLDRAMQRPSFRAALEGNVLQIAREVLTIFIKLHRKVQLGQVEGYFIYQDLKPANILLSPGEYMTLIDLGAVTLRLATRTTDPTAGCITAGYAAPEAADGRETTIDQRFDLYTLGVTLWQVVTQRDPQALGGEFPHIPVEALRSSALPPATLRIIARALERDPARRYQSAAEMRREVMGRLSAVAR